MNETTMLMRITRLLQGTIKLRRNGAGFDLRGEIRPHMSSAEIHCYERLLDHSEIVVEYGLGGSTLLALERPGIKKLISVDSDPRWVDKICHQPAVASAVSNGTAKILHVDIGTVGNWGKPINKKKIDLWPKYPATPWEHVDRADLVFVDGRFRVACILESALLAQPHTKIAVHDFWNRPKYHAVLPFLEVEQRCDTLGVFHARSDIDWESEMALLIEARGLPA
jgi:hypothetical protein